MTATAPALPRSVALPLRNDTMLGVCQALGEDLGVHPNLLRIAFASLFYFSPFAVIATYLALGAIVAAARWSFPDRALAAAGSAPAIASQHEAIKLAA